MTKYFLILNLVFIAGTTMAKNPTENKKPTVIAQEQAIKGAYLTSDAFFNSVTIYPGDNIYGNGISGTITKVPKADNNNYELAKQLMLQRDKNCFDQGVELQ